MAETTLGDGEDALVSKSARGDICNCLSSYEIESPSADIVCHSRRSDVTTEDWPQLSKSAVDELVTILTFLADEALKNPTRIARALSKCTSPIPWFDVRNPTPLLRAMEGTDNPSSPRPPLHCDHETVRMCLEARKIIEELVPEVVFDEGRSSVPEVIGMAESVNSGAHGVYVQGKLNGPLVHRGVVVGDAAVWLPERGRFCFADSSSNGSSNIRKSTGSQTRNFRTLPASRAADIIRELANR